MDKVENKGILFPSDVACEREDLPSGADSMKLLSDIVSTIPCSDAEAVGVVICDCLSGINASLCLIAEMLRDIKKEGR